jgi:adenylate cyclase, class 2
VKNIEIKLECRDPGLARNICRTYGAAFAGTLNQTDTYYRLPQGRLKKRETPGERVEYVHYERADQARPRPSRFTLYSAAEARRRFGKAPMPVWVVVRKVREVFIVANIRIHLDEVPGLGHFVEFEAEVSTAHDAAQCHESIATLREVLGPALGEPVALSYADLAAQAAEGGEVEGR